MGETISVSLCTQHTCGYNWIKRNYWGRIIYDINNDGTESARL